MFPDQETNPQPFSYRTIFQPTEPHWPQLIFSFHAGHMVRARNSPQGKSWLVGKEELAISSPGFKGPTLSTRHSATMPLYLPEVLTFLCYLFSRGLVYLYYYVFIFVLCMFGLHSASDLGNLLCFP